MKSADALPQGISNPSAGLHARRHDNHGDPPVDDIADLVTSAMLDAVPHLVSGENVPSDRGEGTGNDGEASMLLSREPAATARQMTAAEARSADAHPVGDAAAAVPPKIPLAPLKRLQARFNPLADGGMYLAVFLGGCLGAALRSPLTAMLPVRADDSSVMVVPYVAALVVNVLACFVYGLAGTYLSRVSRLSRRWRQLLDGGVGMGLCGAFSVMAMLMLQGFMLLRSGRFLAFFGYMLLSFCLSGLTLLMGRRCGAMIPAGHGSSASTRPHAIMRRRRHAPDGLADVKPRVVKPADEAKPLQAAETAVDMTSGVPRSGDGDGAVASVAYEPAPITAELSVVPNPTTGEVG